MVRCSKLWKVKKTSDPYKVLKLFYCNRYLAAETPKEKLAVTQNIYWYYVRGDFCLSM